MKVLVAVPTAEMARYGKFYDYINMLRLPKGSSIAYSRGQSPAANRNILIRLALQENFTHILFIDDDVAVPDDACEKLIAHDKDMVTGLYLMRNYPHRPIIFDIVLNDARCAWHFLERNEKGLIKVVASGLGCCLIKTDVFRKMEEPWITIGEYTKDQWSDDISFFNRARLAGFELYCDLSVQCGHMCTVTVYPTLLNDNWYVAYDTQGTLRPTFPIDKMSEKERIERQIERERYDYSSANS